MKIRPILYAFLLLLSSVIWSVGTVYCDDAKDVLKKYLDYRSKGRYQKCCSYYTVNFGKLFIRNFGNICPDWFIESEMHFKESKILDSNDNGQYKFIVETIIEDPTGGPIFSKAIEHYAMVVENGEWKIDNWTIEYR